MEPNKLFVYGILKCGYELDLRQSFCKFLGKAQLPGADLYGIGPKWVANEFNGPKGSEYFHGVGLKFTDDLKRIVYGELFEIPEGLWPWLDSIEQNGRVYTRKIVQPCLSVVLPDDPDAMAIEMLNAWVYEYTFPGLKEENIIEGGVF